MPSRPSGSRPHAESAEQQIDLLFRHEQELLARILQHAEKLGARQPELLELVQSAIVRAVGELLLLRSAEETAAEIVEILKKAGPHPPKGAPLRDDGPHPPKPPSPPGPGQIEPLTGPHPPKPPTPPGPGQVMPLTGPHPPKPPSPGGPGMTKLPVGPHPPKPPSPPGPGAVKRDSGPHPPKPPSPPGPGQVTTKKPLAPNSPAKAPVPPGGPHPPKPPSPGPGAARRASTAGAIVTGQELRAAVVRAEEFLMPAELRELIRYTQEHEHDFALSEVVSPGVLGEGNVNAEYRRSRVLMNLGAHEQRILARIRTLLPEVLRKLQIDAFDPARSEVQITASNDGDFFHDHSDNGHPDIASRALTFVYFFHEEPRAFQGGELRLYNSRFNGDFWVRDGKAQVIVPEQNQMVFFPSDVVHEITPVVCPSRGFAQSRFTVNGWLHRM